jgi:hypothetical protein
MNINKEDIKKFWQRNSNSLIKINNACFPLLWALAFFISVLESFTYAGFSFKHLLLPFQPLLVISILSGILARLYQELSEQKRTRIASYRTLLIINRLAFLPLLLSTLLIFSLEWANYPNYVFSKFHLQPQLLLWTCFLSGFLIFLDSESLFKKWFLRNFILKKRRVIEFKYIKQITIRVLFIVVVAWIFFNNLFKITGWIFQRSSFMIKNPLATYDEKMRYSWGEFYNYMLFIRKNTNDNAVIMYPPMKSPWSDVGNGGLIRYFLYPRQFVQNITDENAEIDKTADYVMLAWGTGSCLDDEVDCHGWPKKTFEAEWILYKNPKSTEVEEKIENTVYNFKDKRNQGAWGLIKIKIH